MEAWVEITKDDGSSERHKLEEEETTIGRSPVAGIPLVSNEELEPEHLLLAPRSDGCWVAVAEGAQTSAFLQGEGFSHGVVPWDSELHVGSIRLRITDRPPQKEKDEDKTVGTPVVLLVLGALPVAVWMLMQGSNQNLQFDPAGKPPALFAESQECPVSADKAVHRARDAEQAASHKRERYPFDAQDGIEAVRRYQVAESCYREANYTKAAERVANEGNALKKRINEDYKTHKLRLERSLEKGRHLQALREARALNSLIRHTDGNYAQWMQVLERRLRISINQASKDDS